MKSKIIEYYLKRPKTIVFFLTFVLLSLRVWERFLFPGLWAEDGFLFLREAIMFGPESIFRQYAGYFHTLPRIIAYLTYLLFPVLLYPYIIMIACIGFFAFAISRLAGEEFSELLPSNAVRFLLSISLCLVPGLYEVLGNLANLHWILFFYFCIISIRSLNSEYSYWEIFFIFLICASTGEPIVLIPVIFLKVILSIKRKDSNLMRRNSLILLIVLSFSIMNFLQKEGHPPGKASTIEEISIAANFTWNQYLIYQPLIGDKKVAKFYDQFRTVYRFSGIIIGFLVIAWTFKKKFYFETFFFPILFSVFLIPLLTWIVRPGSLLSYIDINGIWDWRYSFILSPWGLMLWVIIIYSIPNEKWKMRMLYFFFAAYFLNMSYRFQLKPYNKNIDWFTEYKPAEKALKTGCPKEVKVLIHPLLVSPILGTETKFHFTFELENNKTCN